MRAARLLPAPRADAVRVGVLVLDDNGDPDKNEGREIVNYLALVFAFTAGAVVGIFGYAFFLVWKWSQE